MDEVYLFLAEESEKMMICAGKVVLSTCSCKCENERTGVKLEKSATLVNRTEGRKKKKEKEKNEGDGFADEEKRMELSDERAEIRKGEQSRGGGKRMYYN